MRQINARAAFASATRATSAAKSGSRVICQDGSSSITVSRRGQRLYGDRSHQSGHQYTTHPDRDREHARDRELPLHREDRAADAAEKDRHEADGQWGLGDGGDGKGTRFSSSLL